MVRGPARPEVAADRLHASTRAFRARVDAGLAVIREAAALGRVGVSFSAGKDSTVLLHLVRSVIPDAPAALFDSGCEMPETLALAAHYGAQVIHPRLTYPEMARYSGWWGYPTPVDAGCPFPVKTILIDEPADVLVVRERLSVCAIGLRAEESSGRRANAATRGMLYRGANRTWYLAPLAFWSVADVWAYIAEHDLEYHPVYDAMARLGIPREEQRLGMSLGTIALEQGRASVLRKVAPIHFAQLAAEFPGLRDAQ